MGAPNAAEIKSIQLQLAEVKRQKLAALASMKEHYAGNKLRYFQPHEKQTIFFDALKDEKKKVFCVQGGNRCLGGNTKIYDPLARCFRKVSEINEPHYVLAFDSNRGDVVIAEAEKPFQKGIDQIFLVELSNGMRFEASGSHLILCRDGMYHPLSSLRVGDDIPLAISCGLSSSVCSPLLTNSDTSPSVHPEDAPRLSETVQGSRCDCLACRRSCRSSDHLSTPGAQDRISDPCAGSESRTSCKPSTPASDSCPTALRSIGGSGPLQSIPSTDRHSSGNKLQAAYIPSLSVSITAITYLRNDVKWDFHVPMYNNYICCGIVHHNSGKTTSLIAACVGLLQGFFPWSDQKLRFEPPVKIRLCGEDMGHHVKEVLLPKLKDFLPSGFVQHTRKNTQGVDAHWTFTNGSTLEILSYEQDTDIYEGWDGHVVLFDEPPPRSKYVACKRGLVDHDGICLFSFTPLKEPWIYDEIVTNPDPAYFFVQVDTLDNPHLSHSAIEEFKKSLTPEEQEARLRGGWLFLQGLVYKDFDPNVHVKDDFEIPNDWSVYVAIDTHPRTEQAILFLAVDKRDNYYVCHEVYQFGTPEEIVDWITTFHKKVHEIDGVIVEPASQGDQNRGESTFDIIEQGVGKLGVWLELGSKDLAGGILKVKDCLRSRNSQPSLFVFRSCSRTLYEFGRYVWDEWRMEGKDAKQRPKDKDDHMMENLRRLIQHPVRYRSRSFVRDLVQQANSGQRAADSLVGY